MIISIILLISISIAVGVYFALSGSSSIPEPITTPSPAPVTTPVPKPSQAAPIPVPAPATALLKVFKRTSESDANCCGGDGGAPQEIVCPEGSYVNAFFGGSGSVIDRIGVKCSNGITLGPHGGGGGVPFITGSDSGFNKIHVKSGRLVDNIKFFADNKELGAFGGGGGGGPHDLNCNDGKIMGLKLRTGSRVDRIQVVCGKDQ